MNRIHSLVWNRTLGCIVVASKLAADKQGSATAMAGRTECHTLVLLALLAAMAVPFPVLAGDVCEVGQSTATATGAYACGLSATAYAAYSTALGNHASSDGVGSTAVGYQSEGLGALGTALGGSSNAHGDYSTALGYASYAGDHATSIGLLSTADGDYTAALGFNSHAEGDYSVALGAQAAATGYGSLALGVDATADDTDGIALGRGATAKSFSIAMGAYSNADSSSTALGYYAQSGFESTALGDHANASGDNSLALGEVSTAAGTASTSLGAAARAAADNSIALGARSIADRANTMSVGAAGSERQIVNMAAGSQATDAVNVSQMMPFATALGGSASFSGGAFLAPTYMIQGASYSDVGSAFDAVDDKLTDLDSRILTSGGAQGPPGPPGPTGPQGPSGPSGGGPDQVSYSDSSHATILLSDEHGTVIGNVADGVVASDAVNQGQLDDQVSEALESAQTYADANASTTLEQANAYTDTQISKLAGGDFDSLSLRVNALGRRVAALDDRVGRVAALGVALAMTAPDARIPGDNQLGVGVGSFRGHSAVGIGYSHMLGRGAALRVGAAVAGHGDNSVGAGINFGW